MSSTLTTAETGQELKRRLLNHVSEMFDANYEDIHRLAEESDNNKAKVNFAVSLDYSHETPRIKTEIKFSKAYSEDRYDELPNPDQPDLPLGGDDEDGKPRGATLTVLTPGMTDSDPDHEEAGAAEEKPKSRRGRKPKASPAAEEAD